MHCVTKAIGLLHSEANPTVVIAVRARARQVSPSDLLAGCNSRPLLPGQWLAIFLISLWHNQIQMASHLVDHAKTATGETAVMQVRHQEAVPAQQLC